jgi:hypothetical protein
MLPPRRRFGIFDVDFARYQFGEEQVASSGEGAYFSLVGLDLIDQRSRRPMKGLNDLVASTNHLRDVHNFWSHCGVRRAIS